MFIDTHCHLNISHFQADTAETISRALDANVGKMIVIGCESVSCELALKLADSYESVYAVVGTHPNDAAMWSEEDIDQIRRMSTHPKVAAIGETGLDYHHQDTPVEIQERAFRAQMRLASELKLPVAIHCREAYCDALRILEEEQIKKVGGVMHCWAGSPGDAEHALSLGMYLGFGGTVTYKKADNVRESVALAPMDRILLETDAPFLSPVPYRGKRNEPSYIPIIAEAIAQIKNTSIEEIARITTENALRLFPRLADSIPQIPQA